MSFNYQGGQAPVIDLGYVSDNPGVTDWAQHIEDRITNEMILSGSGAYAGTLIVTDRYPLERQLNLDDRIFLKGAHRVTHHSGSSCGFFRADMYPSVYPSATWPADGAGNDEYLVRWSAAGEPSNPQYFSNFGSGAQDIHFTGGGSVGGVRWGGAQQAARLQNVYIRGFEGPTFSDVRVGLMYFGDTHSVTDLFIDSGLNASGVRSGCIGIDMSTNRCYSDNWRNFTVHNCGIALKYADLHGMYFENFETELCTKPIVGTYDSRMVEFKNCNFRHTDELIDLQRMKWYDSTVVKMSGLMADNNPGIIRLSDTDGNNEVVTSEPSTFDFIIEKRAPGNPPTNWTNRRIM